MRLERIASHAARIYLAATGTLMLMAWLVVPRIPFPVGGMTITLGQEHALCGSWAGLLSSQGCAQVGAWMTGLSFLAWSGLALVVVAVTGCWPWPER